jgi:hypothetical protein
MTLLCRARQTIAKQQQGGPLEAAPQCTDPATIGEVQELVVPALRAPSARRIPRIELTHYISGGELAFEHGLLVL